MLKGVNELIKTKLYLVYLLTFLTANAALGFISFGLDPSSLAARDSATALTAPFLVAFAWWAHRQTVDKSSVYLSFLLSHRRKKRRDKVEERIRVIISENLRKSFFPVFALAVFLACFYILSQGIADTLGDEPKRTFLIAQAIPIWTTGLFLLAANVAVLRFIKRHLRKHFRVRLFEIEHLRPLCMLVLHNFFIASVYLCIFAVSFIFITVTTADVFLLTVFSLIILLVLFQPIFEVHNVVADKKSKALERINEVLKKETLETYSKSATRRLVDSDTKLQFISDLLTVRSEIEGAPSWPLTLPFAIKVSFLVFLPLLSWTGAGLVSQAIKQVL